MKGGFESVDFDILEDIWRRQVPERFFVDALLLESHTRGCPTFDFGLSHWHTYADRFKGFIAVKSSTSKLYPGANPLQAHINSFVFEDYEWAKKLLDPVVEGLRSKGIQRLVFGQDNLHFFPGVPQDWSIMMQFLKDYGFQVETEQVDLERDMATYEAPPGSLDCFGTEFEARVMTSNDLPALNVFFETTFSGRWQHDVLEKWKMEGPETVVGLFDLANGACIGFALIQGDGCRMPIGGAVWKHDLGPNWGSLGPIGISESVRGRGLGDGLLAWSLLELQRRGARKTIIDWTTLVEFYGKHGFSPVRKYNTLALPLIDSH